MDARNTSSEPGGGGADGGDAAEQVRQLSARAFYALVRGDNAACVAAIDAVNGEYGLWGMEGLISAWVDTSAAHTAGPAAPGRKLGLKFLDGRTGELTTAEATPPHVVWAGRFMAARISGDFDTSGALVEALRARGDGHYARDCINEVLAQCEAMVASSASPALAAIREGREPGGGS